MPREAGSSDDLLQFPNHHIYPKLMVTAYPARRRAVSIIDFSRIGGSGLH